MTQKNIIDHIESYLGTIDYGWKGNGPESDITIARFRNQPTEGMSTYTTLGLSHHVLGMSQGQGREARQEFIFSAFDSVSSDEIVSFMLSFSGFVLTKHEALLRGQVIGPAAPIFSSSSMNSIYASIPVMFDDTFAACHTSTPSTILVWLIPIFEAEANYINEQGWESFEDILERDDPDLWDLNRHLVINKKP